MFYTYSQNNSGGYFITNDDVREYLIIEADSVQEANSKMYDITEDYGEYCECCGLRWDILYSSDAEGKDKPMEKNYCYNIEKHGVGGLNINDCRVEYRNEADLKLVKAKCNFTENSKSIGFGTEESLYGTGSTPLNQARDCVKEEGRFPANIIFDEEAGKLLDEQSGERPSGEANGDAKVGETSNGVIAPMRRGNLISRNDTGGASRFFYCPKASKKDKTENGLIDNTHVTVKPTELIKYLVKLVTPPQGICLDICEGSGTHVKAVLELNKEGFDFNYIGFENDEESYNIACEREKIHK